MHQTLTYELITVEEDQVSARSTVVQRADRQTIQNPSMPGLKMNVSKFTGTGDGSVTFDLGRLLPSLTILDVHTEMTLEMNVGGQPQAMTMKSDVNFRLEEK